MPPLSDSHHSLDPSLPRQRGGAVPHWEEIELFLAGQASPEDRTRIETWLETSPNAQRLLAGHRKAVVDMVPQPTAEEAMATLRSIQHRIAASPARAGHRAAATRRKGRTGDRQQWAVVGTIACLAIAIVLANSSRDTLLSRDAVTENAMHTVATAPGQHARFHLPDGTSVTLAPGSALRYENVFGGDQREVHLDGEALFTVTHRAGAPFTVRVADRSVQVLGTTFAVRQYASDTAMRVVVAEGRVAVMDTVLGIGDAAVVHGSRQIAVEHGIDIASALAWTSGRLVFDRTPLRDVLPELSRWYGMTITATDQRLLSARVTTTLENQNPQDGLDILATLVQADVIRTANEIRLLPK